MYVVARLQIAHDVLLKNINFVIAMCMCNIWVTMYLEKFQYL